MPYIGRYLDRITRKKSLILGIGCQIIAVAITAVIITFFGSEIGELNRTGFIFLVFFGFLSSIGTNIMDIAVASDLVPAALPSERLPHFNSRLRQLDLLTEVTSPVLAGAFLLMSFSWAPLFGFYLIVLWNVISFYPEYFFLKSILDSHPGLNKKKVISQNLKKTLFAKLISGWAIFIRQPVSHLIFTYSLLWISVLSPHGVLLTAFLKGGWSLPEPIIGTFRALGAFFGLAATIIYPRLHNKLGLAKTTKAFISFQAIMVILALFSFFSGGYTAQICFLIFILLSRIGLYGFSLGETESRQILIPENLRGEINGVASSLTSLATLILFGFGILFSSAENFKYLICISVVCVSIATIYIHFTFSKLKLTE